MTRPGRKPETSDEEILRAIALHPDRVVTASEIADCVGMTSAGVNKRLPELVDDGVIVRKKVGANAVIYWLSPAGREQIADD
jgi:DNA-binding MarR family transcriptional regulator